MNDGNEPSDPIRLGVLSGVPLFQMGLRALFDGRADFRIVVVSESGDGLGDTIPISDPQVVLIDGDLPGAGALAIGAALRNAYPRLGVVLLGRQTDDLLFRALDSGFSAFVAISARPSALLAAAMHAAANPSSFSAPDLAQALARRNSERSRLSPREMEVLRLLRDGHTVGRIAAEIGVTESTAKTYLARIYDKLGVRSRAEALAAQPVGR
jgi:DNA-binding NarL/FixJ family response regulator